MSVVKRTEAGKGRDVSSSTKKEDISGIIGSDGQGRNPCRCPSTRSPTGKDNSSRKAQTGNTRRNKRKKPRISAILSLLVRTFAMSAFLLIFFTKIIGVMPIHGDAMAPFYLDGDYLVFSRIAQDYSPGDVVVYRAGDRLYIGRIAGCPGDTLEVREDGLVLINGRIPTAGEYCEEAYDESSVGKILRMKEDSWYILCDRRSVGEDSRKFGCIESKQLLGRAACLYRHRIQ